MLMYNNIQLEQKRVRVPPLYDILPLKRLCSLNDKPIA